MPEVLRRTNLNPAGEYLSGGVLLDAMLAGTTALSFTNDDVMREFGYRIYEEMINDPQVYKAINVLKIGALGNDLEILPSTSEESNEYSKALKVTEFCQFLLDNLESPLKATLDQMLDALIYGHKVAEIIYSNESYNGRTVLVPKRLKVKPIGSFNFLVDSKLNLLGITSANVLNDANVDEELVRNPLIKKDSEGYKIVVNNRTERFVNRDKFMLLTLREKDQDPRGRSFLRPAFNAWHLKTQIYPEYLRFLLTCSIPLLVGYTPKDDEGRPLLYKDETTGNTVEINPVQALRDALLQARNSTAIALRGGSNIQEIGARNSGVSFYKALEILDEQIDKAILLQTLATSESRYMSRAASTVHMTVLEQLIWDLKTSILNMIKRDLFIPAVRFNFGPNYTKYIPKLSLGDTERRDFSTDANAVATLFRAGYITNDQMKSLDAMLGLPIRGNEKIDSAAQLDMTTSKIAQLANVKAALSNIGVDTTVVDSALGLTLELLADIVEGSKTSGENEK